MNVEDRVHLTDTWTSEDVHLFGAKLRGENGGFDYRPLVEGLSI